MSSSLFTTITSMFQASLSYKETESLLLKTGAKIMLLLQNFSQQILDVIQRLGPLKSFLLLEVGTTIQRKQQTLQFLIIGGEI